MIVLLLVDGSRRQAVIRPVQALSHTPCAQLCQLMDTLMLACSHHAAHVGTSLKNTRGIRRNAAACRHGTMIVAADVSESQLKKVQG